MRFDDAKAMVWQPSKARQDLKMQWAGVERQKRMDLLRYRIFHRGLIRGTAVAARSNVQYPPNSYPQHDDIIEIIGDPQYMA